MEFKQKVLVLLILYLVLTLPQVFYGAAVLSEEITDYTALVPGRNVYTDHIFLLIIAKRFLGCYQIQNSLPHFDSFFLIYLNFSSFWPPSCCEFIFHNPGKWYCSMWLSSFWPIPWTNHYLPLIFYYSSSFNF